MLIEPAAREKHLGEKVEMKGGSQFILFARIIDDRKADRLRFSITQFSQIDRLSIRCAF